MPDNKKPCSNAHPCECTAGCSKHARCCDCVAYHKKDGSLPVCLRGVEKK